MNTATFTFNAKAIEGQINALKAQYGDQYVWGVRFDDDGLKVGHVFDASRVWDDGEPTGEYLAGTCCIEDDHLHVIRSTNHYTGTCYIVCGVHAGYGEDPGEILMTECEIMAVAN